MNPQLSQQDLAAWIGRGGSPWEFRHRSWSTWLKGIPSENPKWLIAHGYEIRLAPGALNEWNLPHGVEPHNPDGLTPEQITEGGLYRACVPGDNLAGSQCWQEDEWWDQGNCYDVVVLPEFRYTYRVPITTPLPPVKESLTPQTAQQAGAHDSDCHCGRCREDRADNPSATGQSKTPRTDEQSNFAYLFHSRSEVVPTDFARALETELTAALAEKQDFLDTLTAIYAKLDIKDGDAPGTEKVSDTVQRYVTAALAQRDEARRLLGEAKASLIRTAYWMAEQTGADEPPYPEPENFCACNHCTEYGELLTLLSRVEQITNHLSK